MKDIITTKGLFERLIRLETKLDMMKTVNKRTDVKFSYFAVFVLLINSLTLYLVFLVKQDHVKLLEFLQH